MEAAGWVISPIISKLVDQGFSYISSDTSEKLKQLEIKVVQLELMLGLEVVQVGPHRNRLEPLLKELKSAFYEAEDILDEVEYYRLERQILPQPDGKLDSHGMPPPGRNLLKRLLSGLPKLTSTPSKLNQINSTTINHPSLQKVSGTTSDEAPPDMSKKELKKILEKIENIINEAHKILQLLNLTSHGNVDKRQTVVANSRGAVTTAAPPPVVIGRDEDRDKIIAMLHEAVGHGQPESSSGLCYSVIGIHGIPGSGKSTLAQLVCEREKNDKKEEKEGHFDLVMWVHVSENFSVDNILSEMLEEATGKSCPEYKSRNTLQENLEKELCGKRFILVLDDVWYDKNVSLQQELQNILSPLRVAKAGSKILVTSRTEDALRDLRAVRRESISELDEKDFLNLFMHYALESSMVDDQDRRKFETIAEDIAKKLKRSPLAARTVGRQLRIRPNVDFWRRFQAREQWDDTMDVLWWSYQLFDEQVRRCFAYCSIFPRRHRLYRDELVKLWVAEGFIKSKNTGEEMEDVARDYFDELVSTSFLLLGVKNSWESDYYTIHDLLHDLAEKVAGSDCFRIEKGWTGEVPSDVCHLFVTTFNRELMTQEILKLQNLRTLIIDTDAMEEEIEREDFDSMFTRLRKLRTLKVRIRAGEGQFSVPASIGQLKHIRYLNIRISYHVELILPITFNKLYHMQVLDVGSCRELVFCPGQDMSNLVNLRHILTIRGLNLPNITRLTSLQTLPTFRVRKEQGYELWHLKHLNKLRGFLWISGLENVGNKEEALEANLAGKVHLTDLILGWDNADGDLQAEILEGLCPPLHLETLKIVDYKGSRYPDWMVANKNGPKQLQRLELFMCSRLGGTQIEFFVHLHELSLIYCRWDTLPDNMELLTSLKKLSIRGCNNIRSLPTLPQSLEEFTLVNGSDVFQRSCQTIGDPNWHKIQHIPKKSFC